MSSSQKDELTAAHDMRTQVLSVVVSFILLIALSSRSIWTSSEMVNTGFVFVCA